mmetsp:Transcript_22296/g.61632  ORF Transcript_22296/g.61632 Transcript_22296/m.61632 type:complete len:266 (+) Transcript_22296:1592-2389(+)
MGSSAQALVPYLPGLFRQLTDVGEQLLLLVPWDAPHFNGELSGGRHIPEYVLKSPFRLLAAHHHVGHGDLVAHHGLCVHMLQPVQVAQASRADDAHFQVTTDGHLHAVGVAEHDCRRLWFGCPGRQRCRPLRWLIQPRLRYGLHGPQVTALGHPRCAWQAGIMAGSGGSDQRGRLRLHLMRKASAILCSHNRIEGAVGSQAKAKRPCSSVRRYTPCSACRAAFPGRSWSRGLSEAGAWAAGGRQRRRCLRPENSSQGRCLCCCSR